MSHVAPKDQSIPSMLLNSEENQLLFSILGPKRQSKATAVVQMFHAHPDRSQWTKFKAGVVCFVKDSVNRSYYIRLISVTSKSTVYEQEVYNQFTYKKDRPFFHSFPGDHFMVGLNFADEGEAFSFHQAVTTKLGAKKEQVVSKDTSHLPPSRDHMHTKQRSRSQTVVAGSSPFAGRSKEKPRRPKGKQKLDIGYPKDFRHLAGIGFDSSTGFFDSSKIDPQWRKLLDTVGVTNEQLKDERTATFITDFVEKHGGIEEANRQLEEANKKQRGELPSPSRSRGKSFRRDKSRRRRDHSPRAPSPGGHGGPPPPLGGPLPPTGDPPPPPGGPPPLGDPPPPPGPPPPPMGVQRSQRDH